MGGHSERCNKNTPEIRAQPEKGINLLKWPEKFQSEEAHVPGCFLPADLGCDRGRLFWYEARRRRGGGRYSQMDNLIGLENVRRSNTGARSPNIQCLGEFNELDARRIRST